MLGFSLLIAAILGIVFTSITGWQASRGLTLAFCLVSAAAMAAMAVVTQTDLGTAVPGLVLSAIAFPVFQRRKLAAALGDEPA